MRGVHRGGAAWLLTGILAAAGLAPAAAQVPLPVAPVPPAQVSAPAPVPPAEVGLSSTGRSPLSCESDDSLVRAGKAGVLGSLTPEVRGTPRVADPAPQDPVERLQVSWEIHRHDPSATTDNGYVPVWSAVAPSPHSYVAAGDAQAVVVSAGLLREGALYRLRARTHSRPDVQNEVPGAASGYAGPCFFRIDVTAPAPTRIESLGPYTLCGGVDGRCAGHGGPEQPGTFRFSPGEADVPMDPGMAPEVIRYSWRLTGTGVVRGDPWPDDGEVVASDDGAATLVLVPPTAGVFTLHVQSQDAVGAGPTSSYMFKVDVPSGPVAFWSFIAPLDSADPAGMRSVPDTSGRESGRAGVSGTGGQHAGRSTVSPRWRKSAWMGASWPAAWVGTWIAQDAKTVVITAVNGEFLVTVSPGRGPRTGSMPPNAERHSTSRVHRVPR